MRAAPAPPGLVGPVRAHARCPPEASGCAERARAAGRRTCEVSLEEREGGCAEPAAWGASTPHLEAPCVPAEPAEHPTQVMRNLSRTQRRTPLPLDASIV
ncbi:PREDICTED: uncharacterized protein LOC101365377 [Odobenus rosmarus divergens]|uniref:Uncharacterized protein LOC101365377 n=1 Tax=Odobenus rosmarus divergens TaxID=9708 RepID=A0A9B0G9U5_ODORO